MNRLALVFPRVMNRFATLCLAFAVGPLAHPQQPSEWRPNITDDNKAATWDDTAAFLVNMLSSSGSHYLKFWIGNVLTVVNTDQFRIPGRCSFSEREFDFVNTHLSSNSYVISIDLSKVDPLSIRVLFIQSLGSWEVEMEGTNAGVLGSKSEGAQRQHVAVDDVKLGRVKEGLLQTQCAADEKHCHASAADTDSADVEFFVDQESAKRFARAAMHAALLCGGTKAVSPF